MSPLYLLFAESIISLKSKIYQYNSIQNGIILMKQQIIITTSNQVTSKHTLASVIVWVS